MSRCRPGRSAGTAQHPPQLSHSESHPGAGQIRAGRAGRQNPAVAPVGKRSRLHPHEIPDTPCRKSPGTTSTWWRGAPSKARRLAHRQTGSRTTTNNNPNRRQRPGQVLGGIRVTEGPSARFYPETATRPPAGANRKKPYRGGLTIPDQPGGIELEGFGRPSWANPPSVRPVSPRRAAEIGQNPPGYRFVVSTRPACSSSVRGSTG